MNDIIKLIEDDINDLNTILNNIDVNPKMYTKNAKVFYDGKKQFAIELLEKIKKIDNE